MMCWSTIRWSSYCSATRTGRKLFVLLTPSWLNAWENLKTQLTSAQFAVQTTVEKVLDLSREVVVFREDI